MEQILFRNFLKMNQLPFNDLESSIDFTNNAISLSYPWFDVFNKKIRKCQQIEDLPSPHPPANFSWIHLRWMKFACGFEEWESALNCFLEQEIIHRVAILLLFIKKSKIRDENKEASRRDPRRVCQTFLKFVGGRGGEAP